MKIIYTALTVIIMFFDNLLCTVSTIDEVAQDRPIEATQHDYKVVVS